MSLPLPLCIGLAVDYQTKVRIIKIQIGAAENYSIEYIEILDLQLQLDFLAEREVLSEGDIFVHSPRISQLSEDTRGGAQNPRSGIAEIRFIDHRKAFVHIVVGKHHVVVGNNIGAVTATAAIAQRIASHGDGATGSVPERRPSRVGQKRADLPAAQNCIHDTTFIEERSAFSKRQLVGAGNIDHVRLVVIVNGPFRFLIVFVQRGVSEMM